jgi:hypothetical protein
MDSACDYFLAGSSLAENENRKAGFAHASDKPVDLFHGL